MATPNFSVIFQGIIAVLDNLANNAPQAATLDLGNPTIGASLYSYQAIDAPTGGQTINFGSTTYFGMFVQNLSSTNNLEVEYTPTGGVPTTVIIGPNGVFAYFDPGEVSGAGLIGALGLEGIGGTVPCVVLLCK